MYNKKIGMTVILLLLVALVAGCGSRTGGLPLGFEQVDSQLIDGVTISQYVGPGPVDPARDAFAARIISEGWNRIPGDPIYTVNDYTGIPFVREDDLVLLHAQETGDEVTIVVVIAALNLAEPDTPSPTPAQTQSEGPLDPPEVDTPGRDFNDVPRYPDSVRMDIILAPGYQSILYLVPDSSEAIATFYESMLEDKGWTDLLVRSDASTLYIQGFKSGVGLVMEAASSSRYKDVYELRINLFEDPTGLD